MRKTALLLWVAMTLASVCRADSWTEDYNRLLGKYVTARGVKYAAWKANAADTAALDKIVAAIAQSKPEGSKDEKLAFYFNAYNANILHGVLESYPTKSVRDIAPLFGFFTQSRITVGGEKMSFNHLEKDIIHGFGEPRMHFALNCASASCPPLLNKAWTAANLNAELDKSAAAFLNNNKYGVEASDGGKGAAISKIFDWYAGDFQAARARACWRSSTNIASRRCPPTRRSPIQEYNWSLNAVD